jgi:hypothetical protein
MKERLTPGTILVLKKDFPPYPIGTEFHITYGVCGRMILNTPNFGSTLPNGEKIPSMSVKMYYEYEDIFKAFGGWEEWFEVKQYTEIDEWSSHCIKVKGKALTDEVIEKIKILLKTQ